MRFSAGLVATGLASLAAASSSPAAAIYEYPGRSTAASPLEVSPNVAQLALAQRLGVTKFYALGVQSPDDRRIELLDRLGGSSPGPFGDDAADTGRLVLSIAGLEEPAAFVAGIPAAMESSMALTDAVGSAAASQLLKDLASRKAEAAGQQLYHLTFGHSYCMLSSSSMADKMSNAIFSDIASWSDFKSNAIITSSLSNTFPPKDDDHMKFVSSYLLLHHLSQAAPAALSNPNNFAFCHFQGLSEILSAYGSDSQQASFALSLYKKTMHNILSSTAHKSTLLLTPPGIESSADVFTTSAPAPKQQHRAAKRSVAETPLSLSSAHSAHSSPTIPTKSTARPNTLASQKLCHSSEDSCNSATNSCSGHGECKKSGNGCWSCTCAATQEKRGDGIKTTFWAGPACSKKDVSVPFNIFLVFGITMVLVVVWAVGLLVQVGEDPLPSVLAAGVAPPKRS